MKSSSRSGTVSTGEQLEIPSEDEGEEKEEDWEEEDEFGAAASNSKVDVQLFHLLTMLKRDDAKLYDKETKFFDNMESDEENHGGEEEEDGNKSNKNDNEPEQQKKKGDLIRQYFDARAQERMARKDANIHNPLYTASRSSEQNVALESAVMEELQRKQEVAKSALVNEVEKEEKVASGEDFFTMKQSSTHVQEMEDAASLSRILTSEQLNNEDKFLRNYLLNRGWVKPMKFKDANPEKFGHHGALRLSNDEIDDIKAEEEEQKMIDEHQKQVALQALNDPQVAANMGFDASFFSVPQSQIVQQFSERRKKLTKRRKEKLRKKRKEVETKTNLDQTIEEKRKQKQEEIFNLVLRLKEKIKGDGSIVDQLLLKSAQEDFEDKIDAIATVEELVYTVPDDDEEENEDDGNNEVASTQELRREIKRAFMQYYNLFYEDVVDKEPVRFAYRKVARDNSLSIEEILAKDDWELEKVAPMEVVKSYDGLAPTRNKFQDSIRKQKTLLTVPSHFRWDGDYKTLHKLAKKKLKLDKKRMARTQVTGTKRERSAVENGEGSLERKQKQPHEEQKMGIVPPKKTKIQRIVGEESKQQPEERHSSSNKLQFSADKKQHHSPDKKQHYPSDSNQQKVFLPTENKQQPESKSEQQPTELQQGEKKKRKGKRGGRKKKGSEL